MKTRNGFVSNSSSTSFIIGVLKEPTECPHCHRKGYDIKEVFGKSDYDYETTLFESSVIDVVDDTLKRIGNYVARVEGLQKGLIQPSHYYDSAKHEVEFLNADMERAQQSLELLAKYQNACQSVHFCSVSYHDELTNKLLADMEQAGDIMMEEFYEG